MINKKLFTDSHSEKAVAVIALKAKETEEAIQPDIDELLFLGKTAGANIIKTFLQRIDNPDTATFIRKGKLEEVKIYIKKHDIELAIFDTELSGSQLRNLQDVLKIKIIDRATLILDIFARRAKTAQAKVQVELAQYQYLLPRLRGLWTHLERQAGGIGTRGPGETEIETDRRIVQNKISLLKKRLEIIEKQTSTQRKNREELVQVALVGYTNVGKSSLMNVLAKSDTLVENKLFATLDTTTRKTIIQQTPFLLSDTVGFIRQLPHHLIESFKSTLEEAKQSHILLHVIDLSDPAFEEHIKVVQQTLHDIGTKAKKIFMVFNKLDIYQEKYIDNWLSQKEKKDFLENLQTQLQNTYYCENFFISVHEKKGIAELKTEMLKEIQGIYKTIYPYKIGYY